MAGILRVDTLESDSNLALKIATANVAFIDSNGLNVVGGNLTIGATQFAEGGQIQTAGIADDAVTSDKILSVANTKISGVITTSQLANNLTVNASSIISSANIDFKVGTSQNTAFRIEDTGQLYNSVESTTGTDYRGTLYAGYMCRAWVEFNGTGTLAVRASGNVSSVTDNGTGDYTVNFATAFPDADYSIVGTGSDTGSWGSIFHTAANAGGGGTNPTSSSCRVLISDNNGTSRVDDGFVNVAVFR